MATENTTKKPVNNSDVNIDTTPAMTQDEFLEAKVLELLEAKLGQVEANEVTLGVRIMDLKEVEGKDKLDANNNPIVNQAGEVEKWAPTYYATLVFNGGELQQRVTKDVYSKLEKTKRYVAKGRLVQVTPEKGFAYMKPEFNDFFRLF